MQITNIRPERFDSDTKFVVFVEDSQASELADGFYNDNQLWKLEFKCKTWSKVESAANRIDIPNIVRHLESQYNDAIELKYSRNAGCNCGCSPGYIGFSTDRRLAGKNVWISGVTMTEAEAATLQNKIDRADADLVLEIASNTKDSSNV